MNARKSITEILRVLSSCNMSSIGFLRGLPTLVHLQGHEPLHEPSGTGDIPSQRRVGLVHVCDKHSANGIDYWENNVRGFSLIRVVISVADAGSYPRYMSRDTAPQMVFGGAIRGYSTVIAAIVESALVTWVGLLLYGVATVAPQGHITVGRSLGSISN